MEKYINAGNSLDSVMALFERDHRTARAELHTILLKNEVDAFARFGPINEHGLGRLGYLPNEIIEHIACQDNLCQLMLVSRAMYEIVGKKYKDTLEKFIKRATLLLLKKDKGISRFIISGDYIVRNNIIKLGNAAIIVERAYMCLVKRNAVTLVIGRSIITYNHYLRSCKYGRITEKNFRSAMKVEACSDIKSTTGVIKQLINKYSNKFIS